MTTVGKTPNLVPSGVRSRRAILFSFPECLARLFRDERSIRRRAAHGSEAGKTPCTDVTRSYGPLPF